MEGFYLNKVLKNLEALNPHEKNFGPLFSSGHVITGKLCKIEKFLWHNILELRAIKNWMNEIFETVFTISLIL